MVFKNSGTGMSKRESPLPSSAPRWAKICFPAMILKASWIMGAARRLTAPVVSAPQASGSSGLIQATESRHDGKETSMRKTCR